jgi:RNA-splicing ligase RtcB
MSRGQAKRELSMDDYRATMANVYTTSVNEATLDEAPMAYKDAAEIEALVGDTVEVVDHLVPVYNFKAGEA